MTQDRSALMALLFLTALLYFPLLLGDKTLFSGDLAFFNLPMKRFLHQAFQEHFLPFWNPDAYLGAPYMASLQSEVFYPPNLLFLVPDFITANNLIYIFHVVLLVGGTYALLRYWGVQILGATAAALVSLLGGAFVSLATISNHFHSTAWLPAVFFAFSVFRKTEALRYFGVSVLCVTAQTLAGSPEMSILTVLLLAAFILAGPEAGARSGRRRAHFLGWVGCVVAALGLSAFQLLPTYSLMQESTRHQGISFGLHSEFSMTGQDLVTLIYPASGAAVSGYQGGLQATFIPYFYMGVIPVFFACLGLLAPLRQVRFWTWVFLVGLLFALGKTLPFYEYVYEWVPFLKLFRFPQKFFLVCAFALVFLTGYWVDYCVHQCRRSLPPWLRVSAVALLLMLAVPVSWVGPGHSFQTVLILLLFQCIVVLGVTGWLNRRWIGPGIVLILFLDLFVHNHVAIVLTRAEYFRNPPPLAEEVARDPSYFRLFSDPFLKFQTDQAARYPADTVTHLSYGDVKNLLMTSFGSLYGIQYVQGFPGLELKHQVRLEKAFHLAPPEEQLRMLGRLNVKYRVAAEGWQPLPGGGLGHPKGRLVELPGFLPRAFLVSAARVEPHEKQLETWFSAGFDPRAEALLEQPLELDSGPGFHARVNRLEYFPNRVEVETEQSHPALLVLLDGYFPGWEARVNGRPQPLLRADYFFRAVRVPMGPTTVEFSYHPPLLREGVVISIITLVLLITAIRWVSRKK